MFQTKLHLYFKNLIDSAWHSLTSIISYNICTTAKIMYVSHKKTVFRIVRLRLKVIHIFIAVHGESQVGIRKRVAR